MRMERNRYRAECERLRILVKDNKEEAVVLRKKLDDRSDLFIEREFKLMDRFLTSQVKTYAITDEINAKKITQADVDESDWDAFRLDKIEFLEQCAKDAGEDNPRDRAVADFENNIGLFRQEFESEHI